jgi:hypothetical protein
MESEQLAEILKQAIDGAAARHSPSRGGWGQVERRLRREPWRRAAIAAVSVAAAAAVVLAAQQVARSPGPEPARPAPVSWDRLAVLSTTGLPGEGVSMATGYGAVWVPGAGVTYQVDQVSGRVVRKISTPGTSPAACGSGVTTGSGAVWVTYGCRGMYRIDPWTGRVTATILVPNAGGSLAAANGLIWVGTQDGQLVRIDPATGTVSGAPIPVVGDIQGWQGTPPTIDGIVSGAGFLWVDIPGGTVARVDPATGTVTPFHCGEVAAVGAGSVWAVGSELLRWDLAFSSAVAINTPPATQPADASLTLWRGQAWALSWVPTQPQTGQREALQVTRINLADDTTPGSTPIPGSASPGTHHGPTSMTSGADGLWVIDVSHGLLFHLGIPGATGTR